MDKESNIVFITLDSCRFDTAERANIPTIRSLGPLRKALTQASYTAAAHASFFNAHFPVNLDADRPDYYSEYPKRLIRIKKGRISQKEEKKVLFEVEGSNIIEGFEQKGYYVLGAGGVAQFYPGSQLNQYFKNFIYCGEDLKTDPFTDRSESHFPLNHISEITEKLKNKAKWFLFINAPETHYPYDSGKGIHPEMKKWLSALRTGLSLAEGKEFETVPDEVFRIMHGEQIKALENFDQKLKKLIEELPRNQDILFIICGDHGECFGETFMGRRRWGHIISAPSVLEVPLVIGTLPAKKS
jgi:membrane-anchored protein YejM (alkaline phosphatase superfamily)